MVRCSESWTGSSVEQSDMGLSAPGVFGDLLISVCLFAALAAARHRVSGWGRGACLDARASDAVGASGARDRVE
jgi:hypothetical protein